MQQVHARQAGLLRTLFTQGVVLVTIANMPSRELHVMEYSVPASCRSELLGRSAIYHCLADAEADTVMAGEFEGIVGQVMLDGPLEINGRSMPCRRRAEGVVWFDFEALCVSPGRQHDDIELVRTHHTVFLSGVLLLGVSRDDRTRYFIWNISTRVSVWPLSSSVLSAASTRCSRRRTEVALCREKAGDTGYAVHRWHASHGIGGENHDLGAGCGNVTHAGGLFSDRVS